MKNKCQLLILWFCTVLAVGQCAGAADPPQLSGKVLVFAAASTTGVINAIGAEFMRLNPGVTIRTSFGASSTLAQQILAGAQADLFLSASPEWTDFLQKKMLLDRQHPLLGNQLVVVVPEDSSLDITRPGDLAQDKVRHLALADPRSVPAGIYARQALETLKLWKQLEARVSGAADVRQALHFVETGAAEAGIVYATDAAASKSVRVVVRLDPKLSEPIRYPLALLKHGSDNAAAIAFYKFLSSPASSAIFRHDGFLVLPESPSASP